MNDKKQKNKLSPFIRNILISISLISITVICLSLWLIFRPDNKTDKYDLFNIEMISELTTLECRYHTVSVLDVKGNPLTVGEKYVWMEFDVIVDVGIDTKKVIIEEPNSDGIVKIYLPPAKILGVREDKSTIKKPVLQEGLFTKITQEDEMQMIHNGIEKLKNDEKTREILLLAGNSTKTILEKYITDMGKLIGKNYKVEWIKNSGDVETEANEQSNTTNS